MLKFYFRGIGRCRHSSNFSNRQTPANTNSLNSGSGTHGSHGAAVPGGHPVKGNVCNCNIKKHNKPTAGTILVSRWPFNKLKKIFLGYKDANEMGELLELINSSYSFSLSPYPYFLLGCFRFSALSFSYSFLSSFSIVLQCLLCLRVVIICCFFLSVFLTSGISFLRCFLQSVRHSMFNLPFKFFNLHIIALLFRRRLGHFRKWICPTDRGHPAQAKDQASCITLKRKLLFLKVSSIKFHLLMCLVESKHFFITTQSVINACCIFFINSKEKNWFNKLVKASMQTIWSTKEVAYWDHFGPK